MRWWGWGVDGQDPSLSGRGRGASARRAGRGGRKAPAGGAGGRAPAGARAAGVAARRSRRCGRGALTRRPPGARVAARGGQELPRPRAASDGDGSGAPDVVVYPASRGGAAVLAACQEAGAAVIPFGGGTSVVGGVEALRGELSRPSSRSTWRASTSSWTSTAVARWPRSRPGCAGPGRGAARRARPHARPLPAVVRVRHDRRLRGHPLGRAGLDRLRAHRRARAGLTLVSPTGEIRVRPVPASAAGPKLRELLVGSEGTLGVICDATLRSAPDARGASATRAGRSALRGGGRRLPHARAGGRRARRGPPLGRGGDAPVDGRRRHGLALRSGSAAPTCACAATRAAAS